MNSHKILKVGLTGGICCGKSEVQKCWEWLGAKVVDLDKLAHVAMSRPDIADEIFKAFGNSVRAATHLTHLVDRPSLAKIVFRDQAKLNQLEGIIHPLVDKMWRLEVENTKGKHAVIVASHPLLYEKDAADDFDIVVCVGCRPITQQERLMKNRGLSLEQAQLRIKAQLPILVSLGKADYILGSECEREVFWQQAAAVWTSILQRVKIEK